MEESYFENEPKKTAAFYIALGGLALFTLMSLGVDGDEFLQRKIIHIPDWYFYIVFGIDFLALLSLVGIAFFKKLAIFAFPVFILLHFYLHQFYLSTFLYTDVTNIFLFIGAGLFTIIPKWKYFK